MSKGASVSLEAASLSEPKAARPWRETTTAQLIKGQALEIGDGYRAKNSELVSSGIPFARAGNINNGFRFAGADHLPSNYAQLVGNKISRPGDTVFTSKGTVGRFAYVADATEPFIYSPQLCFWRSQKHEEIVPRFLFYWMQSKEFLEQVEGTKGQTDMADYVNLADQRRMFITLPSAPEQGAISELLGNLDDKIALLNRQSEILEGMAGTLFRQWFVEEVDEQWETCTVGDLLSIRGGTTPSTKEATYWDGDIAWTSPRDLASGAGVYLFDTSRKITCAGLAQVGSGLLPTGTVLLSSRAPIGYLAITDIPLAINQGYIAMVCNDGIPNYFAYLWCKHHMDEIKAAGNGSTFDEISKSNFKALPFRLPPAEKLEAFDGISTPLFSKLRSNELQTRQLEKLRDTLLPKLISGEVRVTC